MPDHPHFQIPLNLPHAGRIARRIITLLFHANHLDSAAGDTATMLVELLDPYYEHDENPPAVEAERTRQTAALLARQLVDDIELDGFGSDRLGQCVRNLFECLELGREGADISLRAGENPRSMQRPR